MEFKTKHMNLQLFAEGRTVLVNSVSVVLDQGDLSTWNDMNLAETAEFTYNTDFTISDGHIEYGGKKLFYATSKTEVLPTDIITNNEMSFVTLTKKRILLHPINDQGQMDRTVIYYPETNAYSKSESDSLLAQKQGTLTSSSVDSGTISTNIGFNSSGNLVKEAKPILSILTWGE